MAPVGAFECLTRGIDTVGTNRRLHLWALGALLLAALIFGGGGSRYGLANLCVQLTALGALAFHRHAFLEFWRSAGWPLRALVALSLALPMVFLIPLPEPVWSALPGRELIAQSLNLLRPGQWAPLSVEPVRTLLALTALITPLAVLTIGMGARRDALITLGWIVVGLGLANMALGAVQVASNGTSGLLYPEIPMPGILFGTFANRNTTGVFLVCCLALAMLLPMPRQVGGAALPVRLGISILLVLAILLTRSRTAVVLSGLPIIAFAWRELSHWLARKSQGPNASSSSTRILGVVGAGALALGALASVAVMAPGRLADVAERFQDDRTDARVYIWEDAAYSAGRFWPVGSGMGTFDDVFQVDESLENITLRRAGRAHNDYLEVAIEAGLAGLALIAAWLAFLAWASWRARLSQDRWIAWSGAIALGAIALQSVTDYPLRNQSMLAVAAFALVILLKFGGHERGREKGVNP